jgi:hypothetical protein
MRRQTAGTAVTTFLDAAVSLRGDNSGENVHPDTVFSMKTYEKIAKDNEENVGDLILLPINLFFETLSFSEQEQVDKLYLDAKEKIDTITVDNRREVQDDLQQEIFNTLEKLDLPNKMIKFCQSGQFVYPDLSIAGTLPHHSPAKTFTLPDYVEITAISLLSKLMVPIWGEFIKVLGQIGIDNNQREKIAFDLIEPSLEDGAFERIYSKLSGTLSSLVGERRKLTDKKASLSATTSSFIITHNGIDDQMFDSIVMATIIVKRMATYECFPDAKTGTVRNAMVYIDDGIKRTSDTRIQYMRNNMNTMPRKPLPSHDQEDNSSILDHASKTSKKPIDVPITVITAVEKWELPRLVIDTHSPDDVYQEAARYYDVNGFDVSPLCQAMIASFIGTRFGGSKCINYLPPKLHQRLVVLLQLYLIDQGMYDLASLVSAQTPQLQIDGGTSPIAMRIRSNLRSSEYQQCQNLFKGHLEKPVVHFGKRPVSSKKIDVERIDFVTHIDKIIDWLVKYNHYENMAPALWRHAKLEAPVAGSDVQFDENIIRNLCRFYLIFHGGKRPF